MSASHGSKVLWEQAYQALSKEDKDILSQYEKQISEHNKIIIDKKLREDELKQWTIKIAGKSLKLRELGQNIISFINYSQPYLHSATSSEPHAALAWSCISFLLPLILNQNTQTDTMMAGLSRVSHLIAYYLEREKVYLEDKKVKFQETIVKLYSSILVYQARMLSCLHKNSAVQFGRNMAKVDKWESWLNEVDQWDECCKRFTVLVDVEKEDEYWYQQLLQLSKQHNTSEQILAALDDIRQQKLQRLSKEQERQRIELIRSLSSDYKRQKDSNPQRVPGTCEWFVRDQRFCEWRDARDSRLLHVYANPGCGKSVLAKYIIDERLVATSDTVSVLYFFFKDGQEAQQTCANAIAAMLHQLYTEPSQKGMAVHAIPKFEAHGTKLCTMFEELWEIFEMTLEDPTAGEIVCVIDALDECLQQDRERLMRKITEYFSELGAIERAGCRLKLLITSRPYGYIDVQYGSLRSKSALVRLDGSEKDSLIAAEINLVIDAKVPEFLPDVPELVQKAIIKHLQGIENRTYLWLYLIMDYIKDNIAGRGTEKKIKRLIEKLPPTLNKAYHTMLGKSRDLEQARLLLHIVIASKMPLSVSEIKVALELAQAEYVSYNDIQTETESDEQFKNSLKDLCGLLLSVHDSRVYLIHQTAREFLTQNVFGLDDGKSRWQGPINIISATRVIARACISYLCLQEFQTQPPWNQSDLEDWWATEKQTAAWQWVDRHIFLRYAAENWAEHFKKGQDMLNTSLPTKGAELCRVNSGCFLTWYSVYCAVTERDFSVEKADLVVPSSLGLVGIVKILIDEGGDVNARGGAFDSALQAASYGGHKSVVQLLLENGADINAQGGKYSNALYAASSLGNELVVQLLLENGADVNAQGGEYSSALQAVSYGGHEPLAQLLLEKGADVNAQGGYFGNALQAASHVGHESVVQLLLENGADVNAQGGYFGNALQAASCGGHESVVQLLLKEGADVNARDRQSSNALYAASGGGHESLVQLLLEKGADVSAQGGEYGNALQAASSMGHKSVVQLLLENGADVNAQDGQSSNALQATSYWGYESVVQLLLENGADVNAQGGDNGNALYAASSQGNELVVQHLLEYGADVNAQGGKYSNALYAASSQGNELVVRHLLENGADVNAQGGVYSNALYAASSQGNELVVQLLLEKGADVNAQGDDFYNPLRAASYGGHESVIQLLLENGADVNAQGGDNGNALYAASFGGHESVVQLLLETGADINAQGGHFGNALQAASYEGHELVVQLLLDKGADVNARGGEYGNALQVAVYGGHEPLAQLLLEKGADVNAQGGHFGNALQAASRMGHESVVQLLLQKGANINAEGGEYGNALQAVSYGDHEPLAQLLLEKGADVNAQGGYFGNALQAASYGGHESVVQLLLDKGADVNTQGGEHGNALQAALSRGRKSVVRLLLNHGAQDINGHEIKSLHEE